MPFLVLPILGAIGGVWAWSKVTDEVDPTTGRAAGIAVYVLAGLGAWAAYQAIKRGRIL